jgi:hypothetical protein
MRVMRWRPAALAAIVQPMSASRQRRRLAVLVLSVLASCASVDFEPDSEHSGRFTSRAFTLTFLGKDYPAEALRLARGNAADSALPEMVVQREIVIPYLWRLDFLLDFLCLRYAEVSGTWGETAPR